MVCPFCLHKKTEVYNTRVTHTGLVVWRRRRCLACGKTFTTQEKADPAGIWRVSSAKKILPYSPAQLMASLLRACDHRTDATEGIWYVYGIVEQKLAAVATQKQQVIPAADIVAATTSVLKRFDPTAAIKYISYHEPPMDARTLRKHLRR